MTLKPAAVGSGIRFRRTDIPGRPIIGARYNRVTDTSFATTIGFGGVVVSTIEHLLAALAGFGVDNVMVELNGPEVPIFDGSAAAYLDLLTRAGLAAQSAPRRYLKLEKSLLVTEEDAFIKATPDECCRVDYLIDFSHPLVGKQEYSWRLHGSSFAQEIAKARTFGFFKDVQSLQKMGLARGGSLENAIVFDDCGILNGGGFRYQNECVRHKILDFLGDLALAGMPVLGHFQAYKAGHSLHNRFLRELMNTPRAYAITSAAPSIPPFFRSPPFPVFAENFLPATKAL